jgi:TorA maturation chaperone TorD
MTASLSSHRLLGAQSRAYGLMARLLLRGADDVAWARIADLPELWSSSGALPDRDELAAEHHSTFHLGVFPYGGAFLSDEGKAGALSDRATVYYEQVGFSPRLDEVAADHLGVMLAFLSFATGAQADALEDGKGAIADRIERTVGEFIESCVLSWMPTLHVAIESTESDFWANVVWMALALVVDHRGRMRQPQRPVDLPAAPSPLDDEKTGLRGIAEFLLTPALSGVFLSRADISRLGRRHDVPRGFGDRAMMLTNLLRSAVELRELPALLDTLDELLQTRSKALTALADVHGLHAHVEPWRKRMLATRGILLTVADHARELETAGEGAHESEVHEGATG